MASTVVVWADDWPEDEAGERACDLVELDNDGHELSRLGITAFYDPADHPGTATEPQTQADLDEVALRRPQATGQAVAVAAFSAGGGAQVVDGKQNDDGSWQVQQAGSYAVHRSRSLGPPARPFLQRLPLAAHPLPESARRLFGPARSRRQRSQGSRRRTRSRGSTSRPPSDPDEPAPSRKSDA